MCRAQSICASPRSSIQPLTSGGQVQFDIDAAARNPAQNAEGVIRIVNASFATRMLPSALADANGILTLRHDRIDITQFSGSVGGGMVTASGSVAYRPAVQFNVGLKGKGLRLLYPEDVRTDLDLSLAMTGDTNASLLQGQVNIESISFAPDFDLSSFASQFSNVASPPPGQGFANTVKLNVAVRSTSELHVVSPTLSVQGSANLRVIGTAANRVPIDRLQTSYTSDPALPSADIVHLPAFGKTEEAVNATPAQSTTLGAESLVASQVSGQVTSRLQKALGVSQISVDPQLGANNGNQQQGARVTVQQRVTSKVFVTFSTDVTATQNSAVQMQYQLNRKWSVSGVRDQNGGFGLNGRYRKDF